MAPSVRERAWPQRRHRGHARFRAPAQGRITPMGRSPSPPLLSYGHGVRRNTGAGGRKGYTHPMRLYSLLFAVISLVVLVMFLIYVIRGPVDPLIAGGLFVSFLA